MNKSLLACALASALPFSAMAADATSQPANGEWHGSGEFGLAMASGNAKSQNLNAKLTLKMEDDTWKYDFFLDALRNKADVTTYTVGGTTENPTVVQSSKYELTSNRYDAGASAGYKFDESNYLVGAVRYEHDEFSSYQYQYTVSLGYGHQFLKNASDELSAEIGPGYKVIQPITEWPLPKPDSESNVVARGQVQYKHNFNGSTSFVDTFLVEAGSANTYAQNDAGIQVKMSDKLALKAGYQVRHNTDVQEGYKKTDQLVTTNLVYGF